MTGVNAILPVEGRTTMIDQRHLTLPPQRFFWAVLDGSMLPKASMKLALGSFSKRHAQQLGYLLEAVLPLPIEQVRVVYYKAASSTFIACGMARDVLEAIILEHFGKAVSLTPSELPKFIREQVGKFDAAAHFNLLRGPYEPSAVRSMRRRWQIQILTCLVLIGLLLVVGLERRIAVVQSQSAQLQSAKLEILNQVVGPADTRGAQPPELRMTAELRRLQQTRQQPIAHENLSDCTPILAGMLASWPSDLFMQTESISITPTSVTVRGMTPTSEDVQKLADSFRVDDNDGNNRPFWGQGWEMEQPQVNMTREGVQATLHFKRQAEQQP